MRQPPVNRTETLVAIKRAPPPTEELVYFHYSPSVRRLYCPTIETGTDPAKCACCNLSPIPQEQLSYLPL